MTEDKISLRAADLWSKYGFMDGDLFTHHGFDEIEPSSRADDFLESLVRRFLLPACPEPVEVERWTTCHNPIRAVTYNGPRPDWVDGVSVHVSYADVRALWASFS